MARYMGTYATVCPYYIRESERSITCEGFMQGVPVSLRFPDKYAKYQWQRRVCCCADRYWRDCAYAQYKQQAEQRKKKPPRG